MKKVLLLVIGLSFVLSFCQVIIWKTKYTCSGTVVSRHDVPIPGVTLIFSKRAGSKETIRGSFNATTDNDGNFFVNETIKSNEYIYSLKVDFNYSYKLIRDSGDYNGDPPPKGAKNFIVKLQ